MEQIQYEVPGVLDGERIDRAVAVLTELPRATIATLLEGGGVTVDGQLVTKPSRRLHEGQAVEVNLPDDGSDWPEAENGIDFAVLHADDHVIIVDKPAGLVVHPGAGNDNGTLVHGLLERFPDMAETRPGDPLRPGIVHRLDAGTSGLLVVARTQESYDRLVDDMKNRRVERRYLTLLWGALEPASGMVDAPIGRAESDRTKMTVSARGRDARTLYEVLARNDDPSVSLVSAKLETGRTHQIRVHFAAIDHPVVGDARYGGLKRGIEMTRPFLHAQFLRLTHPVTGEELTAESQLPNDLVSVITALGLADALSV